MSPTALWVVPVADLGGVARHVLDVARAGLPGWRLVVLCPEGPLAERLRELGTAVVTGPFGPEAGFAASCRTMNDAVRTLKPDVVHAHLSYADVVTAAVLATRNRPKLVTTEHGIAADDLVYHGSKLKSRLKAQLHSLRLHRADAIIAVSEATKAAMVAKWHPSKPITVIPNGVDGLKESTVRVPRDASANEGPKVLSLSRLAPEKRLPELLKAFARLKANHPTASLVVAGEGPLRAELQALSRQLGVKDSVSFPGFVNAQEAMASADVLIQLSVWENCSYTLLDAVTGGLGVVATPVGGNPEILPERCLVEADDEEAICDAIVRQFAAVKTRANLSERWPSVPAMAQRIVAEYAKAGVR